jgi:hypothetical protein
MSAGICSVRQADSAEDILTRADIALYRAKGAGRNRVVAAFPASSMDASKRIDCHQGNRSPLGLIILIPRITTTYPIHKFVSPMLAPGCPDQPSAGDFSTSFKNFCPSIFALSAFA